MKSSSPSKMNCVICAAAMRPVFTAQVLGKYPAQFDFCDACGFLRVREPFWLAEAYSSAIACTDTGVVSRNAHIASKLAALLYFCFKERGQGRYLDAAGGYGLLTRLMRDYGFHFFWSDKYCENLVARGFEYSLNAGPCRAVTAFEVMEHLEDPAGFVSESLAQAQCDTFIFTTELFSGSPPLPREWWYYSLQTGQHIAFYQARTLETLAKRLGLNFYSGGGLHVLTRDRLSRSFFKFCMGRTGRILASLARRRLSSLTVSDHDEMVRRLVNAEKRAS